MPEPTALIPPPPPPSRHVARCFPLLEFLGELSFFFALSITGPKSSRFTVVAASRLIRLYLLCVHVLQQTSRGKTG